VTKEQKIEMFALRLEGKTLQEIGDKFGCTREYVRQVVGPSVADDKRTLSLENIKYPALRKWLSERNMPVMALAGLAGVSANALYHGLTHRSKGNIGMATIRGILKATGLNFEEAFGGCE
jgi:hypothetical protein